MRDIRPQAPTAADLRAAIARRQLHLYQVAAKVGLNPQRLGAMLRGRIPLSPAIAARVLQVLTDGGA